MKALTKSLPLFLLAGTLLILGSCRMDPPHSMSEEQRKQLEATYDSLQSTYSSMMDRYETSPGSVPADLKSMYAQMQQMHEEMSVNHRQMMSMHMGRRMQGDNMMAEGMGMHMQGHMTGEWYRQMVSMHDRMAALHEQRGQEKMSEMNRRLSEEYNKMMRMIPGLDEPAEVPFNEEGDPALLNGERLYSRNCASCHGSDGSGTAGVFPPLVNSEWVTGDKSVPIRILMNGLTGRIEVDGNNYNGSMPSFRARLSAAEMAAILNHLRSLSEGDQPEITQEDVIQVGKRYSDRTRPWTPSDLRDE